VAPRDVAYDATTGDVYFIDVHAVRAVTPAGQVITIAGTTADCNSPSDDTTPAVGACLWPYHLAVRAGRVYFTEESSWNGPRARYIDGNTLHTIAGDSTWAEPTLGGPATASGFQDMGGITVDTGGNVYLSGLFRGRIWQVRAGDQTLSLVTEFQGGAGFMTTDAEGNLYVSLPYLQQVAEISSLTPPGGGLTVSPTDGQPGTVFTAKWTCPTGPSSTVVPTDGQPLPDNDFGLTVQGSPGNFTRGFQIDGDGAYQVQASCGGTTMTAPFTVTAKPYVALGDSYSSGEGASSYYPDTDLKDVDMCHRGIGAWSVQVAIKTHLTRDFAACSGDVIENITQFSDMFAKPAPPATSPKTTPPNELPAGYPEIPQLDHVSRTGATKLVTFTLGGNNVGFPSLITDCVSGFTGHLAGGYGCKKRDAADVRKAIGWLTNGRKAGCYKLPGVDPDTFTSENICSNSDVPSLHSTYEQIAKKVAPGGTVAVVGYPKLFGSVTTPDELSPTLSSCQVGSIPFSPLTYRIGAADVKWLNTEANTVNTTLGTEVVKANADLAALNVHVTVKFIPVDNSKKSNFDTHRICDTGTPFFHGLEFSGIKPRQWSFHPNDDGIAAYASAITPSL
jgi:hypothetical protein